MVVYIPIHSIIINFIYQHYCNSIENYFSILKAKLKKLDNLSFKEIDENIKKATKDRKVELELKRNAIEKSNIIRRKRRRNP